MTKGKMPQVNPHASAVERYKQEKRQSAWLKKYGYKTVSEARKGGY
jgi:hypothetical protein